MQPRCAQSNDDVLMCFNYQKIFGKLKIKILGLPTNKKKGGGCGGGVVVVVVVASIVSQEDSVPLPTEIDLFFGEFV